MTLAGALTCTILRIASTLPVRLDRVSAAPFSPDSCAASEQSPRAA